MPVGAGAWRPKPTRSWRLGLNRCGRARNLRRLEFESAAGLRESSSEHKVGRRRTVPETQCTRCRGCPRRKQWGNTLPDHGLKWFSQIIRLEMLKLLHANRERPIRCRDWLRSGGLLVATPARSPPRRRTKRDQWIDGGNGAGHAGRKMKAKEEPPHSGPRHRAGTADTGNSLGTSQYYPNRFQTA